MRTILAILLIVNTISIAKADEWRTAANTLLVLDWAQTREIATNDHYYETNRFLGKHPSIGDVNRHFIGSITTINLIGQNLSARNRKRWYIGWTIYQAAYVIHNRSIGIGFKF